MNNKKKGSNSRHGSEFPSEEAQIFWSNAALMIALDGLDDNHEWRVGQGFAVATFEFMGLPALVIVPWGGKRCPQKWITGVRINQDLLLKTRPVVSYLPRHIDNASPEDAIRLFRNGKGFIGRLDNSALYEEFNRSAWGCGGETLFLG